MRWFNFLPACALAVIFVACGRSAPAPQPVPPAPAAAPVPETPPSIDAVRALRTAGQLDAYEHALKLIASSSADLKTRGRAEALLGLFYIDQNRHDDAVPYLNRAADDDPVIAPWMWLRIGDIPAVNRVMQQGSETSASILARIRITALYAEARNVDATNTAYQYTTAIPIDETTEDEFMRLQQSLSSSGRQDLGARLSMRFLTDDAHGRYTEENYSALARMTPSPLDAIPRDAVIDLAKALGSSDHFTEALDLLNRFTNRAPAEAAMPDVRDLRWRSLFQSRHYTELLGEMDEKSLRDPALLLLRARAAWRVNQPEELLSGLNRIEREFPRSPEATDAKIIRAKYYTVDEPKLEIAIANLQNVVAGGTFGNDGENLWALGWTYFLAGHQEEALRTFADYKTRFPDGDYLSNALFWTGKINDRLGRAGERDKAWDDLAATYPYNYFSYRARELRQQPAVAPSEIANGNVFLNLDTELAKTKPSGVDSLERIDELTWVGLYSEAIPDLKEMLSAYGDNAAIAFMLAETYVQAGEPAQANAILQRRFRAFIRHGGTGIPHRFWEILYPLAYWHIIQTEAAKQNVDPYLLAAIARQESLFEPKTVSNAGAVGVMQIMPQEAPRIAAAAGLQPPSRDQLFDPAVNIAIGAAEFAQKRAAMNGNDILAIAAYNAGTEAVGKWLAQKPIDDGDLFVESIPYNETRLYVKTVTRNRFEYRRIYEIGSGYSQQPK